MNKSDVADLVVATGVCKGLTRAQRGVRARASPHATALRGCRSAGGRVLGGELQLALAMVQCLAEDNTA